MDSRKLDRLFESYRTDGNTGGLAEVFDNTAPGLRRLASRLVKGTADVDDLVQSTFLTAIERCQAYRGPERLSSWLAGILVHQVHAHRRRAQLARERESDAEEIASLPSTAIEDEELRGHIALALQNLSDPDRELLEAYLGNEERPQAIAERVGRSPGNVRMAIHRAMNRLRAILPASLALGAATLTTSPELARIRERILEAGAKRAAYTVTAKAAPMAGATFATWIGSIAMTHKLALALGLILGVTGIGWILNAEDALTAPLSSDIRSDGQVSLVAPTGLEVLEARPLDQGRVERVDAVSRLEDEGLEAEQAANALSGVIGRILSNDGAPIGNTEVQMLEMSGSELLSSGSGASADFARGAPLRTTSARTDEEGRFQLKGARLTGMHMLAIDRKGPNATLRVIDRAFAPGKLTDLGDIVLEPRMLITGRLEDPSGKPIEGARVRVALLPPQVLGIGAADLREGWAVAQTKEGAEQVFEPESWLANAIDQLPLPMSHTDAAGAFELYAQTSSGELLLVDHPEFMALKSELGDGKRSGADIDVGNLQALPARTIRGTIRDSKGEPVLCAEVLGGGLSALAVAMRLDLALLTSKSDNEVKGQFELKGLPQEQAVVIAIKRRAGSSWHVHRFDAKTSSFEIELADELTIELEIVDSEGSPIAAAQVGLLKAGPRKPGIRALVQEPSRENVQEVEPGRYRVSGLLPGKHTLEIATKGAALYRDDLLVKEEGEVHRIVLERQRSLLVRTIDDETGETVPGAKVVLIFGGEAHGNFRTDQQGEYLIALPLKPEEPSLVRVDHPAFATTYAELPTGVELERDLAEIRLDRGGALQAEILAGGRMPGSPKVLTLFHVGTAMPEFERSAVSDETGQLRIENLPAGSWSWDVRERQFGGNPLVSLVGGSPNVLAQGTVEIQSGQTSHIRIDVPPEAGSPPLGLCSIGGRLIDGREQPTELLVFARIFDPTGSQPALGPDDWISDAVNARGEFLLTGLDAGECIVILARSKADVRSGNYMHLETFKLQEDEHRELDPWTLEPVQVTVQGADGLPVAGALVQIFSLKGTESSHANSDERGVAEASIVIAGEYNIIAEHPELGIAKTRVALGPSSGNHVELMLDAGVPCSGTVFVADGAGQARSAMLSFLGETAPGSSNAGSSTSINLVDGRAGFTVIGMKPGSYQVFLFAGGTSSAPLSVEIGPEGEKQLDLNFVRAEDLAPPDR